MMKYILLFSILSIFLISNCNSQGLDMTEDQTITQLQSWVSDPINKRESLTEYDFARKPLTATQAKTATQLLHQDKKTSINKQYGAQWDNRNIELNNLSMPFYYQVFGEEPTDGRSLYISMHGGGGAPAGVNDQQYENQKHLYDQTMKDLEGVYLAPRAPSNTWDLWHQAHIDDFFNILIQLAVIKENVNPNKVYLMGYSAGGDGVFQLAPRMADRFAAASMMAGHPNETTPEGLKNLPFALHMGALDAAYDRNKKAETWKVKLDQLAQDNPGTYIHQVQLHEGKGHWMGLEDAVALPWMSQFQRNTISKSIVWKQDDRHHERFYWLGTPETSIENGGIIRVNYNSEKNEINILENYAAELQLFINDQMLDLDQPITVKYQGKIIHTGKVERTIANIYSSINDKGDANLAFPVVLSVLENQEVKK